VRQNPVGKKLPAGMVEMKSTYNKKIEIDTFQRQPEMLLLAQTSPESKVGPQASKVGMG